MREHRSTHSPHLQPAHADESLAPQEDASHLPFSVAPLLQRALILQNVAHQAIAKLTTDQLTQLRQYYNHALVSRREVVTDVEIETWKLDLAFSLSALLFAREAVEARTLPAAQLTSICLNLIAALCADVDQPWFRFAVHNARRPTMIAMPSLPALNLSSNEERFYVQAVSDSWPSKQVSSLQGNTLIVNSRASRRFVDNLVAGDLGGLELPLEEQERSFIGPHSIGWVTRYETATRKVTIIEVDPWARGELKLDAKARRAAHQLVRVKEQRLDAYSHSMRLHEEGEFEDNLVLARLLTIDQSLWPICETGEEIDIQRYIHVSGSGQAGLGPLDEEVFLKSLGSMTAKNKLRSALAISTKARLRALNDRGSFVLNVECNEEPTLASRMIRCGVDGIYVQARVPYDSVMVLTLAVGLSGLGLWALIASEGLQSVGDGTSLALALMLGAGLMYHNLRYKSCAVGETIRLTRMCASDEEMSLIMTEHEMIITIAEAGSKGAGMDGILTCAYSDSQSGTFSVTRPLSLEAGSKIGLKLRLSTALRPLWVDLTGVRAVEEREIWHAHGSYLDKNYLELTATGPDCVG